MRGRELGVSAAYLRKFAKENKVKGLTTAQVKEKVVLRLTKKDKCSLVWQLRNSTSETAAYVGEATVFLSHAWSYSFADVLAVVLDHADKRPNEQVSSR